MGIQKQKGFTIIEVILFLAISSLLLTALLVGINTSINQQRYKDSVTSFIGLVQEQYTLTANVNNQRDSRWKCSADAPTIDRVEENYRGTTDCVIVGRLVQIKDGVTITTSNIVAYDVDENAMKTAVGDVQTLTETMKLVALADTDSVSIDNMSIKEIGWGSTAKILNSNGSVAEDNGSSATLAIVRSPVTGTIGSYVVNEATEDWKNKIITQASAARPMIACVVAAGPLAGQQQAVIVNAGSSNAGGVAQRAGVAGC